eukprot:1491377-Ditylum_brightwellii.AAC.1
MKEKERNTHYRVRLKDDPTYNDSKKAEERMKEKGKQAQYSARLNDDTETKSLGFNPIIY